MKGEHGSPVVYASTFKKKDDGENGEELEAEIPFLKEYTVFNASQVEGLPDKFYALSEPKEETPARIGRADEFFANTKADIRTGSNQSFYPIDADYVRMPPFETLRNAESHAATLAARVRSRI